MSAAGEKPAVRLEVHELKAAAVAPGEYQTRGYVTFIYVCPSCPAGAMCKPCDRANIVIYEDKPGGVIAREKQLKLYCAENLQKGLMLGKRYRLRVRKDDADAFELLAVIAPDGSRP